MTPNEPIEKKEDEGFPEVQSNHNTMTPAKPIPNGNLAGKPDYNPMRAVPNKANNASDVTHTPETSSALVEAKGDRPPPTVPDADPNTASQAEPVPAQAEDRA
jgi:hypothetical protein